MKEYLLLKLNLVFLLSFFIPVGCIHTSPYEDFYESYIPNPKDKISYDHWVEENKPLFLKEGELPKITSVQDIDQSLREYQSDHFIVMGVSNFSGQLQWDDDLEYLAMDLGATVVLKKSNYMHSTTRGGGIYTYNGKISSTPIRTYHRYKQAAFFLVKTNSNIRKSIGFIFSDMTEKERTQYKVNGVKVSLVYKDTPAFDALLFRGDIIQKYGQIKINNSKHLEKLVARHRFEGGKLAVVVSRNGESKKLYINVKKKRNLASIDNQGSNQIGHIQRVKNNKIIVKLDELNFFESAKSKFSILNSLGAVVGAAEFIKFNKNKSKALFSFTGEAQKNMLLISVTDKNEDMPENSSWFGWMKFW